MESLLVPMLVLMVGMFMFIVGMLHDGIEGFSILGMDGIVIDGFFTVAEYAESRLRMLRPVRD